MWTADGPVDHQYGVISTSWAIVIGAADGPVDQRVWVDGRPASCPPMDLWVAVILPDGDQLANRRVPLSPTSRLRCMGWL
jgi:hypothetical protein